MTRTVASRRTSASLPILQRMAALAVLLLGLAIPPESRAASARLDLDGFFEPDGAITVQRGGDVVDPYFAIRALLLARREGLDVTATATAWIRWLLPRQESDGRFARYCRVPAPGSGWSACMRADADDALLAMWMELLYDMTTGEHMPPEWQRSVSAAASHLAELRHQTQGIYLISNELPVGLFMDNVEVYAAWQAIARNQQNRGAHKDAVKTAKRAEVLRRAIEKVFHPNPRGPFLVSTQPETGDSFYPGIVAQVYPVLLGMPMPGRTARSHMKAWLARHEGRWLSMEHDPYPWGLVAIAAVKAGFCETGSRWMERAVPLRYSERWNVLEEAALAVLANREGRSMKHCSTRMP